MIAAKHKTVAGPAQDRLHTSTVSLYSSRIRIMEMTAMNRAPKIRIEFEVSTAPFAPHRSKEFLEMLLNFRMSAVKHVPWTTAPTAERYQIGAQRLGLLIFYKPVRVLLKNVRLFFGNKWSNPNRRLKRSLAN